jgi:hypothetical protein
MRYIGVDLHTTQITVCYWQSEAPQETFAVYPLAQIAELTAGLQRTDENKQKPKRSKISCRSRVSRLILFQLLIRIINVILSTS